MIVYRLARKKYTESLSGKGAAIKGGRWNSPNTQIIYTAENRSLAMAEVSVHMSFDILPDDYHMVDIFIPDKSSIIHLNQSDLPPKWNNHPPTELTRKIGDDFISNSKYLIFKVPSAVTKGDFNLLLNPFHIEFKDVKIVDCQLFPFDRRIFR